MHPEIITTYNITYNPINIEIQPKNKNGMVGHGERKIYKSID